jgi:hypothetical protein
LASSCILRTVAKEDWDENFGLAAGRPSQHWRAPRCWEDSAGSAGAWHSTCELPPATLRLTRTGGVSPGPIDESLYARSPDSGAQFRIADCHYHYNLSPRPLGPGSYLAEILINGVAAGAARFELK